MNGTTEGRWLGISPCDNETAIALRTNALRACKWKSLELISPGPRSRVGTVRLNCVGSAYCPNVTYVLSEAEKHCAAVVGVGSQLKAMGDSTAAGRGRALGAGEVHPASWGSQKCGGRAGGRPKPDVKVTVGGDRPPRLGGDVVAFEDMREILVILMRYEQQMQVAK